MNVSIQQLNQVVQQNASAAEEMSATAEELATQAGQLQTAISSSRSTKTAPNAHCRMSLDAMSCCRSLVPSGRRCYRWRHEQGVRRIAGIASGL